MENKSNDKAICLNQIEKIHSTLNSMEKILYPVITPDIPSEARKDICQSELIEKLDDLYIRISNLIDRIRI